MENDDDAGVRRAEIRRDADASREPVWYGLIDLGKVSCADNQFLASFDELRQARDGVTRREWMETKFDVKQAAEYAFAYAVVALVAVNLLGLAFVAVRAVIGWITAGYTPRA